MFMLLALIVAFSSLGAPSPIPPVPSVAQSWTEARVIKPFGAALRRAPSSDAEVLFIVPCDSLLPVIAERGGWIQTEIGGLFGWVGGGRVRVGTNPPHADCEGGFTFDVGDVVATFVPTGCLSLRAEPSRDAHIYHCVSNGHRYRIVNGPIDPGSGEDWFEVWSSSTGSGWVLAEHIFPSP